MAKNNFLLLSLEDDKINNVANAVSNKSGKKILEQLTEGKATESELAKKLNLAISTVHYNLQQLMKAGLVEADEYHYSEKGREVLHYKLANKYIIIAPQKKKGLKKLFKSILPVALISAGVAGIIEVFTGNQQGYMAQKTADPAPRIMATESAQDTAGSSAPSFIDKAWDFLSGDIAIWFFIGAVFALASYMLIQYFWKK